MLVLSRKRSESIVIDDNIIVTVVEVRGDKVRLGITAPKEMPIHRTEVYQKIQNELAAGEANPGNRSRARSAYFSKVRESQIDKALNDLEVGDPANRDEGDTAKE